MIDDFRILGIAQTRDPKIVKEAFRARAKELHPDLVRESSGDDPLKRHYLFIALTQAYRRILAGLAAAPLFSEGVAGRADAARADAARADAARADAARADAARADAARADAAQTDATGSAASSANAGSRIKASQAAVQAGSRAGGDISLAPHRDPAYAFYKTGMRHYMAIHPSAWEMSPRLPSDASAGKEEEDEEMREKVLRLVRLFPKAYYYFGIVASEHPDSPWAPDAREKMESIERQTLRYKKIIESFGAWRRAGRERGREVADIVGRTRRILKEEGGELRWPSAGEEGE